MSLLKKLKDSALIATKNIEDSVEYARKHKGKIGTTLLASYIAMKGSVFAADNDFQSYAVNQIEEAQQFSIDFQQAFLNEDLGQITITSLEDANIEGIDKPKSLSDYQYSQGNFSIEQVDRGYLEYDGATSTYNDYVDQNTENYFMSLDAGETIMVRLVNKCAVGHDFFEAPEIFSQFDIKYNGETYRYTDIEYAQIINAVFDTQQECEINYETIDINDFSKEELLKVFEEHSINPDNIAAIEHRLGKMSLDLDKKDGLPKSNPEEVAEIHDIADEIDLTTKTSPKDQKDIRNKLKELKNPNQGQKIKTTP